MVGLLPFVEPKEIRPIVGCAFSMMSLIVFRESSPYHDPDTNLLAVTAQIQVREGPCTAHPKPSTAHDSPPTIHHPPSTIHHPPTHRPPLTAHHLTIQLLLTYFAAFVLSTGVFKSSSTLGVVLLCINTVIICFAMRMGLGQTRTAIKLNTSLNSLRRQVNQGSTDRRIDRSTDQDL
jgi:hypothetical protein